MDDKHDIQMVRKIFLDRCYDLIEKGVEKGAFRMKDVAFFLGISSQVASKLVNPTNPRTLTAFELLRVCVLLRKPLSEIIPIETYLTPQELNDEELVMVLKGSRSCDPDEPVSDNVFMDLPEECRQCMQAVMQVVKQMKKEKWGAQTAAKTMGKTRQI